jgi:hypothetical protein
MMQSKKSKFLCFTIPHLLLSPSVEQKLNPRTKILLIPIKSLSGYADLSYKLPASLLTGIHTGEISKLSWLIVLKHTTWAYSLISCTCCSRSWFHPKVTCDLLHRHVGPGLIFLHDPLWDCTRVSKAAQLMVCLFCQCTL